MKVADADTFPRLNAAYDAVFRVGKLSLGLVVPLEAYPSSDVPTMTDQLARIRLAEELGFAAVWLRDVPFRVPSFGDAGQVFDPFVYLGVLAASTERIALGVASLILPLRHPAHVAKAAASVDVLSGGRMLLGVASGDRPNEYPALGAEHALRGARFRESYDYIRRIGASFPTVDSPLGNVGGDIDLLPKPYGERLPLLITGASQQSDDWLARHGDGWMVYPRGAAAAARTLEGWRERRRDLGTGDRPAMQPLYVDLVDDDTAPPEPIHLGLRLGPGQLVAHLLELEAAGVNHVALNLRFNRTDIESTLHRLASEVLPALNA